MAKLFARFASCHSSHPVFPAPGRSRVLHRPRYTAALRDAVLLLPILLTLAFSYPSNASPLPESLPGLQTASSFAESSLSSDSPDAPSPDTTSPDTTSPDATSPDATSPDAASDTVALAPPETPLPIQSLLNLSSSSSPLVAVPASKLIGADGTPGKVFSLGPYKVVERSSIGGPMFVFKVLPPRPLLLLAPATSSPRAFPVVLFQHGWATRNFWFADMLKRVVSHGYIVVAPQMYPLIGLTGAVYEMKGSCAVIGWLKNNLRDWLSRHPIIHRRTKARPDWSKFGLSGQSRGGKVAFGVLRGLFCKSAVEIKGEFLLDPVNGGGGSSRRSGGDSVLTYVPNSIRLSAPVMVLGAGLGGECAPAGDNYAEFYSNMVGPAEEVVVPGYGHADFFNNWLGPGITYISKKFCKRGPARKPMRVVTAGLMVAFFQSSLLGDTADLDDINANPGHSPVKISQPVTKP